MQPCVDKRDAAQKHRDKVKQCAENPKIIANKRRKKLDISKQPPVSKNLRTKDAKSAFYRRSKLAIHHPRSYRQSPAALGDLHFPPLLHMLRVSLVVW